MMSLAFQDGCLCGCYDEACQRDIGLQTAVCAATSCPASKCDKHCARVESWPAPRRIRPRSARTPIFPAADTHSKQHNYMRV